MKQIMTKVTLVLLLLTSVTGLNACGKKGDVKPPSQSHTE